VASRHSGNAIVLPCSSSQAARRAHSAQHIRRHRIPPRQVPKARQLRVRRPFPPGLQAPPHTPLGTALLHSFTAARPSSSCSWSDRRPRSSPTHLIAVRAPAALLRQCARPVSKQVLPWRSRRLAAVYDPKQASSVPQGCNSQRCNLLTQSSPGLFDIVISRQSKIDPCR
jgi:hypothetical protein